MKYIVSLVNPDFLLKWNYDRLILVTRDDDESMENDGISFLNMLKRKDYIPFLRNVILKKGYSLETSSCTFGPEFGSELDQSLPIIEGYIEFASIFGVTQITICELYYICLDIADKLLESVIINDLIISNIINEDWVIDIQLLKKEFLKLIMENQCILESSYHRIYYSYE